MPTIKVEFHRLALKEYDEARKWYAERSAGAAQKFKEAVDEATVRIARAPESLPRMSGPYRWARVRRFRYILVFRPRRPDEMVVVAVAHTSRRPGYWRRRQIE
jgi:plasmid stabilization system protein ParE